MKSNENPNELTIGLLMAMAITKDKNLGIPGFYDNFKLDTYVCTTHKAELLKTFYSIKKTPFYLNYYLNKTVIHGLYTPEKEEYYVELCMNTLSQEDIDEILPPVSLKSKKQLYKIQVTNTLVVAGESGEDAYEWVRQQCYTEDSIFGDPDSIIVFKEIKTEKDIPKTLSITGEKWQIHSIPYNGDNYQPDYNETDYKYPIEYKIKDYLD